ncbi:asparagine synthase (glutamine-hydrolyzing) [Aliikangiella coralliicola]|uniref:asparagine synthase (glutamine-hydrolyzing) n=1 Tax=Aliikangiella coralliicola TaxID=2592383 RepID=A0A545UHG6_9GAMM|nr:asparagine synthase (glutamine-hydrolyzing) [Aliikangiella coralliicola]TQV88898.1 asparagine synthase (glutamine-hydrolyzing) [Aliikangiella coralliicola]
MCGIAGIHNYKTRAPVNQSDITAMCSVITYRGPDGYGEYVNEHTGLGHRRLTIIDTNERSNQPMHSEDSKVSICYNGEVYNYVELKASLLEADVSFRTKSDTEVLLNAYIHQGIESVEKFNGMFAFAISDTTNDLFYLARDRMGIKPLYYTETKDGLAFASEIKSLLQLDDVKAQVNETLIDSYMTVGYCPTNETMFKGIHKVPPGHYIKVEKGTLSLHQYWDMTFDKSEDKGEDYYVKETQKLFEDSVRLQLRSDVPLGVFLSGGIDSSAVVAMMRKLDVKDIKTFSVAWDYGKDFDETEYARKVAKQFDTDHTEYFMSAEDFRDFLPGYIRHMDEPVTEAAAISLYYLAKKTKEKVTVVLSGEGSDEVFGGYPIYKYMQVVENYKKVPGVLRKGLINPVLRSLGVKWKKYADLSEKSIENSYSGVSFYEESLKQSLYTDQFAKTCEKHSNFSNLLPYYQNTQDQDLQSKMQYLDLKTWLVDDLLIKADRMSMAASLELRVPFLDHRFLEFAATMPSKYRLKNMENKYIIKKAMEPYLDKEILYRKKLGFPTPLAVMFQGELYDYVAGIIDSEKAHARGYFKPEIIKQLLTEHKDKTRDHHRVLWQLLVLELWHREFID